MTHHERDSILMSCTLEHSDPHICDAIEVLIRGAHNLRKLVDEDYGKKLKKAADVAEDFAANQLGDEE